MSGSSATGRRKARAPTPCGPPNLWALMLTMSAPSANRATSNQGAAWTASVCSTAPGARRRTRRATSARGWTVPTSLLTSWTDTMLTVLSRAAARASKSTTPSFPTSTTRTGEPKRRSAASGRVQHGVVLDGAHYDRPGRRPARPSTARLAASVPPLVKTTSPGAVPRTAATLSRASSIAWRAALATEWEPDGLPKRPESHGSMAVRASGQSGVVEAWSR